MTDPSAQTPYEQLGGEQALRALVNRFYRKMDELPEADGVRRMHAPDLRGAESKLFMFLSGWLGGPNLYWEKFGHPRLRMRHMPFSIGVKEREQWLVCMRNALDTQVQDAEFRERLDAMFDQTANHMINQTE